MQQEIEWGLLFEAPEPRNIASRPVCWIAATITEGAARIEISNFPLDIIFIVEV
jgi:hypothetical protein